MSVSGDDGASYIDKPEPMTTGTDLIPQLSRANETFKPPLCVYNVWNEFRLYMLVVKIYILIGSSLCERALAVRGLASYANFGCFILISVWGIFNEFIMVM